MLLIHWEHVDWFDVVVDYLDLLFIGSATEELSDVVVSVLHHQELRVLVGVWGSSKQHEVTLLLVLICLWIELFVLSAQLEVRAVAIVVHEGRHHLLSLVRGGNGRS
jgi:hypothetical protein